MLYFRACSDLFVLLRSAWSRQLAQSFVFGPTSFPHSTQIRSNGEGGKGSKAPPPCALPCAIREERDEFQLQRLWSADAEASTP